MEHISKVLGNSLTDKTTMNPKLLETEGIPLTKEQRFMDAAGLSTLEHTFESFKPLTGTQRALKASLALGEGTTNCPFLLIYGGVGNGKTHLIEAIIVELGWRGIFARYWTAAAMFDYLKEGIQVEHGHPDVGMRVEQLCRSGVLILDDLGVEYGSNWEWSQIETIIDYRYRFRNITIVATNMDVTQLRDKSERIFSRFSDIEVSQLVLNSGNDYRRSG